jgi:hypothetical protein
MSGAHGSAEGQPQDRFREAPKLSTTCRVLKESGIPFPLSQAQPEERDLRKTRFLVVALIAMFSIAATAFAANTYDISGTIQSGGTKSKPKAGGFKFGYTIADDAGNLPVVVKAYKFQIAGSKINTSAVKSTCTAAKINTAQNADGCPSAALVGTGSVQAHIGTSGQPWDGTTQCLLKLEAYNAGTNKVALYLDGRDTTKCVAPISQAIDAKWSNSSAGAGLSFTVPDELRHQLGLDVAVVSVQSTWKKKTIKKSGKTVGYFETTGCKGKRSATVTFTGEDGVNTPIKKDIGNC